MQIISLVVLLAGPGGRYLNWSVIHVSVTNLLIIVVMVVVFLLALVVPFPGHEHEHGDASQDER